MVYIITAVLTAFITSHYVFRWRTAMNDFYVAHWQRLRHIEGASQRIQEDTQRFADTVEGLGVSLVQALMTLIAFLPILWGLSSYVKELPLVGPVPQALVFVAVIWAAIGTGALAAGRHPAAGARVPQPAGRGGLPQGAGAGRGRCRARAEPPTLRALFADVRAQLFPAVRELPLLQRRALRLPAGRACWCPTSRWRRRSSPAG